MSYRKHRSPKNLYPLKEENISSKKNLSNGKNYLLIIGINKYKEFPNLNNAVRDAKSVKELLISKFQFENGTTIELYDADATRDNIFKTLITLSGRITPNDSLVVYYSGHGFLRKEFQIGFWVPYDAKYSKLYTFIDNSSVLKYIREINSQHTYLIIDSCYAGSIVTRSIPREIEESESHLSSYSSRRILTSGRVEIVSDGEPGAHSPFCYSILNVLEETTKSISRSQLEERVRRQIIRGAGNLDQRPVSSIITNAGDQGGDFIFQLKKQIEQQVESDFDYQFKVITQSINLGLKEEDLESKKSILENALLRIEDIEFPKNSNDYLALIDIWKDRATKALLEIERKESNRRPLPN